MSQSITLKLHNKNNTEKVSINCENIVEALLLSSGEPLSADKIHKIINSKESCSKSDILEAIDSLKNDYENKEIEISSVASGYRIQAKSTINNFLNIILHERCLFLDGLL